MKRFNAMSLCFIFFLLFYTTENIYSADPLPMPAHGADLKKDLHRRLHRVKIILAQRRYENVFKQVGALTIASHELCNYFDFSGRLNPIYKKMSRVREAHLRWYLVCVWAQMQATGFGNNRELFSGIIKVASPLFTSKFEESLRKLRVRKENLLRVCECSQRIFEREIEKSKPKVLQSTVDNEESDFLSSSDTELEEN